MPQRLLISVNLRPAARLYRQWRVSRQIDTRLGKGVIPRLLLDRVALLERDARRHGGGSRSSNVIKLCLKPAGFSSNRGARERSAINRRASASSIPMLAVPVEDRDYGQLDHCD